MDDHISRQVAIKEAEQMAEEHQYDFVGMLISLPSEDVRPVRHGQWIKTPTSPLGFTCSECGKEMCRFDYCPYCGADMRGEQDGLLYQQTSGD